MAALHLVGINAGGTAYSATANSTGWSYASTVDAKLAIGALNA
jgi:hypothetical protein